MIKVWKVENKKDRKKFALKEMSKARYWLFYTEFSLKRAWNL